MTPKKHICRATAYILAGMILLAAHGAATAATGAYETVAEKVVNERAHAAFLTVGVSDLQRFSFIKKAVAEGHIGRDVIDDGMELGFEHIEKTPLFAGSVFGAIVNAYDAAMLREDATLANASYWNAIAYDRVCAGDAELCQALAEVAFVDSPGSPFLKASLLRYLDYSHAAMSAWLSSDLVVDAAEKCRAAHATMVTRAREEGRGGAAPYRDQMRPSCDKSGDERVMD